MKYYSLRPNANKKNIARVETVVSGYKLVGCNTHSTEVRVPRLDGVLEVKLRNIGNKFGEVLISEDYEETIIISSNVKNLWIKNGFVSEFVFGSVKIQEPFPGALNGLDAPEYYVIDKSKLPQVPYDIERLPCKLEGICPECGTYLYDTKEIAMVMYLDNKEWPYDKEKVRGKDLFLIGPGKYMFGEYPHCTENFKRETEKEFGNIFKYYFVHEE